MRTYKIGKNESGQRMDRFISRVLPKASWAEVQKLFRKKAFKCNGLRSVKPGDFLKLGDVIEVYLSEDSLAKWGASARAEEPKREHVSGFLGSHTATEESARRTARVSGSVRPIVQDSLQRDFSEDTEGDSYLVRWKIYRIYEDDDFLAVCKPAGMLIHSDTPAGSMLDPGVTADLTTIVRKYLKHCKDDFFAPSTASRLDRGTSGVAVFAKNYQSLKKMNEEMRMQRIDRIYHCIVEGGLSGSGEIELSLYKDERRNKVFAESTRYMEKNTKKHTRLAKTRYEAEVLPGGSFSYVRAVLETGRTHQIRASLAQIGHPIVGDIKYGSKISAGRKVRGSLEADERPNGCRLKDCSFIPEKRRVDSERPISPLLHCAEIHMLGLHFEAECEDIRRFMEELRIESQKNHCT